MLAAARIGAVVVPFSTFGTGRELRGQLAHSDVGILLSCNAYRSHDYVQRLDEMPSSPRFVTVFTASTASTSSRTRSTRRCWRDGIRRRRLRHAGHRLHVRLDRHAQGCGAHPRRAARPPAQPQRDPRADRRGQTVQQFAVLLDRRVRVRTAGHPGRRLHAGVLQRGRRRSDAGPTGGREADDDKRFRRRSLTSRGTRASPAGTCRRCGEATCTRSWRRTCAPPTRSCGTTCWA